MKRYWLLALLLVGHNAWAMSMSPAFSRQLAPVIKLYEGKQWLAADARAARLKPGTPAEQAWLARLRASAAAGGEHWVTAERQVALALEYAQWPQEQRRDLLRLQGDIAAQQARWPQAISSYQAALALHTDKELQYRLAGLYYHNRQFAEAATMSERVLRQGWHKPSAIIRLSALQGGKRFAEAGDMAERLIRHEPDDGKWWQQAVSLRLSAGQGRAALALLQTAVDRKLLDEESTRHQLIRLYAWQGLPYRGARLLDGSITAGTLSPSPANLQLLAQLWEGAREWDRAIASWQKLASVNHESKANLRAAELMLQQGQSHKASQTLMALQQKTGHQGLRAKALLVQVYIQHEHYDEALRLAAQLRQSSVWRQRADTWIAYIERRQNDGYEKAV